MYHIQKPPLIDWHKILVWDMLWRIYQLRKFYSNSVSHSEAPTDPIGTKFWFWDMLWRIYQLRKFYSNSLRRIDFVGGHI